MIPDGDFPTVDSPNPENPESFALAKRLGGELSADVLIGTDPDCDRVAAMAPRDGKFVPITGNQMGVLLLDYIIDAKRRLGTMPPRPAAIKSLVTTEMARRVAEKNGVDCYDTFTGFKFIAGKKNALEAEGKGEVIFAYEESIGYMAGGYVRDKDAVTASALIAEMAAWYKSKGMTLIDAMDLMFEKYGYHAEKTINLVMPGVDGLRGMRRIMAGLRDNPPSEISSVRVNTRRDYLDGTQFSVDTGVTREMEFSGSDMLRFILDDGAEIVARPSGTEPKIKIYILAHGDSMTQCASQTDKYAEWAESLRALSV
jgi:phosphoglucomutase